jgi:acyl-homoserine-lactone acylase
MTCRRSSATAATFRFTGAKGLLSCSQSTDPASPHYVDQTLLFDKKQWQTLPFTAAQIRADAKNTARIAE